MKWLLRYPLREYIPRLRKAVLPNLRYLTGSRVRRCRACERRSLFVKLSNTEERQLCVHCRANLRYEMLAEHLRQAEGQRLSELDVLELDPDSPLRPMLARARSYRRTYFRPDATPGQFRGDGAVVEDITHLTLADESLDLIVSSDVLEHVPDAGAAFSESFRVLRAGGRHVFTVPNEPMTVQRAALVAGEVHHLVEPPEYHSDPLDPLGILAFWHFGPDLTERFSSTGLEFRVVKGPEGAARRIVWEARKP